MSLNIPVRKLMVFIMFIVFYGPYSPVFCESPRETPIVKVVRENANSVVNISTERVILLRENPSWIGYGDEFDISFQRFFNTYQPYRALKLKSVGSGVILDSEGVIITNAHVINMASSIFVILSDGTSVKARVMYQSSEDDLAVIKADAGKPLRPIKLGGGEDVMIGETVIAVGNPLGLENSVSVGVISGKNRALYSAGGDIMAANLLQTDAAINMGNSGGALLNLDGELVGINMAVADNAQGIGFAIPVSRVGEILDAYKNNMDLSIKHSDARTTPRVPSEPALSGSLLREDEGSFTYMERLHKQMEQMIQDSFSQMDTPSGFGGMFKSDLSYDRSVNFEEENNMYLLKLDISDLDKDKINIEINERYITISGEYSSETEESQTGVSMEARQFGSFTRTIPMPKDADMNGIKTGKEGGTLIIKISKKV